MLEEQKIVYLYTFVEKFLGARFKSGLENDTAINTKKKKIL